MVLLVVEHADEAAGHACQLGLVAGEALDCGVADVRVWEKDAEGVEAALVTWVTLHHPGNR